MSDLRYGKMNKEADTQGQADLEKYNSAMGIIGLLWLLDTYIYWIKLKIRNQLGG